MSKRPRTLDGFFGPPTSKKPKQAQDSANSIVPRSGLATEEPQQVSAHTTYPFSVPHLPTELRELLNFIPATDSRVIDDQPDLDLLYYQPYVPKVAERDLFNFLRHELFFYRVKYSIKRGPVETQINTPRYTTVFGIDETARFQAGRIVSAPGGKPPPLNTYKCAPRPIPACLDDLRQLTENATGCTFNFVLVNYYSSGDDSISYHSDDERFLGANPSIASLSLGAKRDFLLKHKPTASKHEYEMKPMKFPLGSGDLILMRGTTQSNWLHSIPKRKGGEADRGRINITFRKAMTVAGTENYYRYNVGDGGVYKWDGPNHEMLPWHKT